MPGREVILMPTGKILSAFDHGTIWQLVYLADDESIGTVHFEHRPFAQFYEGATGRNFYRDYAFGEGREYISKQLQGKRVSVEGEEFTSQTVHLLDKAIEDSNGGRS